MRPKTKAEAQAALAQCIEAAEDKGVGATITLPSGTLVEIKPPQNPTPPNPADLVQM